MKYKFNESHLPWVFEQVWEAQNELEIYGKLSEFEYEQTQEYFPKNPKVILDLGCGLGRSAVSINHHYQDSDISYILADRQGQTENKGYMFPDVDEYYNDMEQTLSFCKLNGLKLALPFDTELDSWNRLPKVDFVSSRCACGFHFPITRYMDRLRSVSNPNVTMIFGLNVRYTDGGSLFEDQFEESFIIKGKTDHRFPVQDFLVLRNMK